MKYQLHIAILDSEDIPCYTFNDTISLKSYIIATATAKIVYLVSVYDEVFVSDNIVDVILFYENVIANRILMQAQIGVEFIELELPEVFFQEFNSYEAAYKVALHMSETFPLCYEPD